MNTSSGFLLNRTSVRGAVETTFVITCDVTARLTNTTMVCEAAVPGTMVTVTLRLLRSSLIKRSA